MQCTQYTADGLITLAFYVQFMLCVLVQKKKKVTSLFMLFHCKLSFESTDSFSMQFKFKQHHYNNNNNNTDMGNQLE